MPIAPRHSTLPDFSDVTKARRRNMAAIRGKNTKPEILVRRWLHEMGYRYRLHVKQLPGRPDIVFPARKKIIEVRGCFWHRHPGCPCATTPASRRDFWQAKFEATVVRDAHNLEVLKMCQWSVLVIWECELAEDDITTRLRDFLGPPRGESDAEVVKGCSGLPTQAELPKFHLGIRPFHAKRAARKQR